MGGKFPLAASLQLVLLKRVQELQKASKLRNLPNADSARCLTHLNLRMQMRLKGEDSEAKNPQLREKAVPRHRRRKNQAQAPRASPFIGEQSSEAQAAFEQDGLRQLGQYVSN